MAAQHLAYNARAASLQPRRALGEKDGTWRTTPRPIYVTGELKELFRGLISCSDLWMFDLPMYKSSHFDRNYISFRCGQRWVKQGKRLMHSGGDLPSGSIGDSRQWMGSPGPGVAGAKRSFAAFDSTNFAAMDLDGPSLKRGSLTIRSRLLSETPSPEASGISTQALTESPPSGTQLPMAPNRASFAQIQPRNPTSRYCMQRLCEGGASYALFWVVDSSGGRPVLTAVVSLFTYYFHPQVWILSVD